MMNAINAAGVPYTPSSPAFQGSSLTSLFLVAIIPFLFLKVFSFFNHTWPNFVYRLLVSRLERQIATVEERVFPNRIIQDDIMIRSIMGYVSYCYVKTLRQGTNACDAVSMADYDYSFIYENVDGFDESWVPYSMHYKSLFGRVIASSMELSVMPSIGQAIQVEPGLFVRSLEEKHSRKKKDGNGFDSEGSEETGETSHRAQKGDDRNSIQLNQVDKLNKYVFYDMRKFAENMDEHREPPAGGNADDISSVERPFDAPAQHGRHCGEKERDGNAAKTESSFYANDKNPQQENYLVIEYRRPLPYERSQALCNANNTTGVGMTYDETREAEDVIGGFLARVHGWYLCHTAQRKISPLMAIYPSPALSMFVKNGADGLRARREDEGDFSGHCYVLESASPVTEADGVATGAAGRSMKDEEKSGVADNGITAAVTIGSSTLSGGHVGLDGAVDSALSSGKTFKSLFFPAKAQVLSIIDDFVQERGCYGVPGVVARLNFFLYGAPGTGKTSFVKALARHLRRNLVVVSMSDVLTVDELQKLLQPFELNHIGSAYDSHLSVRPHQSIYVFEDFDAIGEAWAALARDQTERKVMKATQQKEKGNDAEHAGTEEHEVEGKTDASTDERVTGEEEEPAKNSATNSEAGQRFSPSDSYSGNGSDYVDSDGDASSCKAPSSTSSGSTFLLKDDQLEELDRTHLTVEKFLDLFNGFNLPDSFVAVFTTNHPERVHPLITSSNMMDVTLDMGMLSAECATEMVEHYFVHELTAASADVNGQRHLTPAQVADLHAALGAFNLSSDGLSGALLEKMCVECDTVELLTQRLRAADTWDAVNAF